MLPSGGELLLVILIVFLLFGGRELPKITRTLGKWTAVMKRSLNDVRREFNRISIQEELEDAARSAGKLLDDTSDQPSGGEKQSGSAVSDSPLTADELDRMAEEREAQKGDPSQEPQVSSPPTLSPPAGRVARDSGQGDLPLDDKDENPPAE